MDFHLPKNIITKQQVCNFASKNQYVTFVTNDVEWFLTNA